MLHRFDAKTWICIFVLLGIGMRFAYYAAAPPIFGDQAAVGLNIVNKSFSELLGGLDHQQVAPVGFLWIERGAFEILGMNERSMLLWPTLASIAALIVFACWTRILLEPMAAVIATGILATSNFAVRHGVELKPYGGDLLFSLLLLLPATLYLVQRRDLWLGCLVAVTPLAVVMSYPSVFTAGGIWLVLATTISRQNKRSAALIFVFGIVLGLSFFCLLFPISAHQYAHTQDFMLNYWKEAFPPANPLKFVWWLLQVHTGNMFAYPIEGNTPWCAGNFALFGLGVLYWYRSRQRTFVVLLLLPFVITFLAAVLHRYPYGESARITQHLVPAIILFVSIGLVDLFRRLHLLEHEKRARLAYGITFAALLILGASELLNSQFVFAHGKRPEAQIRHFVRNVAHDLGDSPTFIQLTPLPDAFYWYVRELNQPILAIPLDQLDPVQLSGPLWIITASPVPDQLDALKQLTGRASTKDWVTGTTSKMKIAAYGFPARQPSTISTR